MIEKIRKDLEARVDEGYRKGLLGFFRLKFKLKK